MFSIRVAGNIASRKVLASAEYGCAVAGAKLLIVIGHTRCEGVFAAVKLLGSHLTAAEATGCQHLDSIMNEMERLTVEVTCQAADKPHSREMEAFADAVARQNVLRVVKEIH